MSTLWFSSWSYVAKGSKKTPSNTEAEWQWARRSRFPHGREAPRRWFSRGQGQRKQVSTPQSSAQYALTIHTPYTPQTPNKANIKHSKNQTQTHLSPLIHSIYSSRGGCLAPTSEEAKKPLFSPRVQCDKSTWETLF